MNQAKDLAMQVAAAKPEYVRRDEVDQETLEKEKAIYRAQAINEGKPEQIAEKIAEGRLERTFKEACLEEQEFIKRQQPHGEKLLGQVGEKLGTRSRSFVLCPWYEKEKALPKEAMILWARSCRRLTNKKKGTPTGVPFLQEFPKKKRIKVTGVRCMHSPKYRRIILKLSGEALAGDKGFGIDPKQSGT